MSDSVRSSVLSRRGTARSSKNLKNSVKPTVKLSSLSRLKMRSSASSRSLRTKNMRGCLPLKRNRLRSKCSLKNRDN